MRSLFFFLPFFILCACPPPSARAGGLSAQVARRAMCEDMLAQCMAKVRADIPCADEDGEACREKRFVRVRECDFLFSHCNEDEPPVKRIKPVLPGEKKKEN